MQRLFKLGYGYDSHRFLNQTEKNHLKHQSVLNLETEYHTHDKKLIIGGITLEEKYQKKFGPFKARSDGDVLYHAVVNALLSALSQKESRDIGTLFPNTDHSNSNRNSADFLKKAAELIQESDYELLDLKIMVKSVLRINWNLVENNLASFFNFQNTSPEIHIQGTSGEELDGAGNGLGVEVFAVCMLQLKNLQL